MRGLFLASACVCVLAVGVICAFLFVNGLPFAKYNPVDFLTGTQWRAARDIRHPAHDCRFFLRNRVGGGYRCPIGILTAILMARFAPKPVVRC